MPQDLGTYISMKIKLKTPEKMATKCRLTGLREGWIRAGTLRSASKAHIGWQTDLATRPADFKTPTSAANQHVSNVNHKDTAITLALRASTTGHII